MQILFDCVGLGFNSKGPLDDRVIDYANDCISFRPSYVDGIGDCRAIAGLTCESAALA